MDAPTIYHYHPESGQYLSSDVADPSPLEPGVWLYPAHCSTVAPPAEQDGYIRIWDGDGWQQQLVPEPEPELVPTQLPNWDGFNVWMLQETAFKAVCSTAFQNGHGSMVSALFAAYRDVATGKTEPFKFTFAAVCAAGGALPEDRERWATQAAKMHLPETFCQIIKGNK